MLYEKDKEAAKDVFEESYKECLAFSYPKRTSVEKGFQQAAAQAVQAEVDKGAAEYKKAGVVPPIVYLESGEPYQDSSHGLPPQVKPAQTSGKPGYKR